PARLVGRSVVGGGEEPVGGRRQERRLLLATEDDHGVLVVGRQQVPDAAADRRAEAGEARLLLVADAKAGLVAPDRSFVGTGKAGDEPADVVLGDGRQRGPCGPLLAVVGDAALWRVGCPRVLDQRPHLVAGQL